MIRFLRRQLDKLAGSPGLLMSGQWRVQYADGLWTRRMTYDAACEYAEMFGGQVHWIRYDDRAAMETDSAK